LVIGPKVEPSPRQRWQQPLAAGGQILSRSMARRLMQIDTAENKSPQFRLSADPFCRLPKHHAGADGDGNKAIEALQCRCIRAARR